MSVNLRNYTKALYGFDHVMRLVPPSAWDMATPCDLWTARQVAGHVTGVVELVAAAVQQRPPAHDFMNAPGPIAGDDPYASWSSARDATLEALDQQGALQVPRESPMGAGTVDSAIGFLLSDAVVHTWDLARSVGVDERLDSDLVAICYSNLKKAASLMAGSGVFKPPVALPPDASPQDKLLALSGRDPR